MNGEEVDNLSGINNILFISGWKETLLILSDKFKAFKGGPCLNRLACFQARLIVLTSSFDHFKQLKIKFSHDCCSL
jgi:hypothetical protein